MRIQGTLLAFLEKVNRNKIRNKEYPLVFLEFLLLWSLYQKWIANFCLLFSSPDSVIALGRAVRITWCGRWEGQLYYENGYGIWGNTLDFTLSSIDIFFPNNLYSWWENFQLCCLLLSFDLIPLSAWFKIQFIFSWNLYQWNFSDTAHLLWKGFVMPLGFYGFGKILGRAIRAAIKIFNYGRKK